MSDSLRIIFAGTPDFAARHLDALLSSEHQIVGVFTQPDRPAGRGNKLTPSPVKVLAEQHQLPVFQPKSLRPEENQRLVAELHADVMVVVAYGLILPQAVLDMPRLGCINVHGSLLPRWRGAAPIQRSLWAGDSETGVTIMQMDVGLDTGDMMHKIACPIESSDTSASLYDKLAQLGPQGMLTTLRQMASGSATREVQDEALVTYAEKLSKEEARPGLDTVRRSAGALYPRLQPLAGQLLHHRRSTGESVASQRTGAKRQRGASTVVHADKHGIQVATADGILNLIQLQPAGKKPMSAQDL